MTFDQTRRSFFQTLIAAGVGATLDPERLLWVPGRRTYFDLYVPSVPVWAMTSEQFVSMLARIEQDMMAIIDTGQQLLTAHDHTRVIQLDDQMRRLIADRYPAWPRWPGGGMLPDDDLWRPPTVARPPVNP